jgi:hypothetical protein
MTGWRDFAYPFPDDDFQTLEQVLDLLPAGASMDVVWEPFPAFIAAVADPVAALYLRLAVNDGRPSDVDGKLLVGTNEIWVELEEREECERLLSECCPSPVVWSRFAKMCFASDEAHRQFGRAYRKITGLPAWAPPKRQPITLARPAAA